MTTGRHLVQRLGSLRQPWPPHTRRTCTRAHTRSREGIKAIIKKLFQKTFHSDESQLDFYRADDVRERAVLQCTGDEINVSQD